MYTFVVKGVPIWKTFVHLLRTHRTVSYNTWNSLPFHALPTLNHSNSLTEPTFNTVSAWILKFNVFSLRWYKFEIISFVGKGCTFCFKMFKKNLSRHFLYGGQRIFAQNPSTLHTYLGCITDLMAELHHLAYQIEAEVSKIPVMYHSFWLDKRKRLHFCIQWFAVSHVCSFLRKSMAYATLHEFHRRTH